MLEQTPIIFLLKGSKRKLTDHLNSFELDCKCTYKNCKRTLVTIKVIDSFAATRLEFGDAVVVNSGFRCQNHNYDIVGMRDSKHKLGLALDLVPKNMEDLDKLENIAEKHFDVVLRYDGFIHCHNKDGLE